MLRACDIGNVGGVLQNSESVSACRSNATPHSHGAANRTGCEYEAESSAAAMSVPGTTASLLFSTTTLVAQFQTGDSGRTCNATSAATMCTAAGGVANGPIRGRSDRTVTRHSKISVHDADTHAARHGSNFGLPIALHLTKLMQGSIGITEVNVTIMMNVPGSCSGALGPLVASLCLTPSEPSS